MHTTLLHSKTQVFQAKGHLNATTAEDLQRHLTDTVSAQENSALLVDMRQVESMDSHGLMVLVSILSLAQKLNKDFGLIGVPPSVRIVLELTQLDRVFELFDSHPAIALAAA
jgi:anti-sigma B factor antagonist